MKDRDKTKEQLIKEVKKLCRSAAKLGKAEAEQRQAEEALKESEKRFKELWDNAPVAYHTVDTQGFITSVNQTEMKMLGCTKEEMIGRFIFEFILPEQRKEARKRFKLKISGKRIPRAENRVYLKKDGSKLHVVIDDVLERSKNGKVIGVRTTMSDITDRRQVEEELQEAKERYRALFDHSLYCVFVHDFKGQFLDANKAALKLLGYEKKDIQSLSLASILEEDQLPKAAKLLEEIKKTGRQKRPSVFKLRRKDGGYVFVEAEASVVYREGKPYAIQGIARDITEAKKSDKELRESKEKYRILAENAMDGIYVISPEGFEYVNHAFERLFGYKAKEVCNKDFDFFDLIYPEDRKLVADREEARKRGKKLSPKYIFRIVTKNGKVRHVEANTVHLPGEKVRVLGILRDITERKQTEEALRGSEEKYRTLVEQANDGIVIIQDGVFKYVNKRLAEISGYAVDELVGIPPSDYIAPEEVPKVRDYFRRWRKGEKVSPVYEFIVRHKEGRKVYVEFNAGKTTFQGKQAELIIVRDVTERKQGEKERQKIFERLRKALEETVNALAFAVEMRDPSTAGHQRRVTNLACAIAREMDLSTGQIEGIRLAGIVHDVGKIRVPAEILSKPGHLDEIDLSMIKSHPEIGFGILKTIEFPYAVAQIMLQHHERLDGSGYPAGLSGDKILLESRILAVADVVEAMASHRPYRPALGVEKALEEISGNKGILYDSDVVESCLRLFKGKKFKFE